VETNKIIDLLKRNLILKMKYLRQCVTAHGSPKKTFKTFEDAVRWAHKMNDDPRTIWAQVAYKCKVCSKFHVGRNSHNKILIHKSNIYGSL
jgi:hypothetical protein